MQITFEQVANKQQQVQQLYGQVDGHTARAEEKLKQVTAILAKYNVSDINQLIQLYNKSVEQYTTEYAKCEQIIQNITPVLQELNSMV